MKKFIYAYKDVKANYFRQPYLDDHDQLEHTILIQRELARLEDPKQIALAKDLVLYKLGVFDDETGIIEPLKEPVKCCETSDFLRG